MDKEDVRYMYIYIIHICMHTIYTHTVLLRHKKKNEIMPFAITWMDLEIILPSEISQKEKNKYSMLTHICGI